MKDEAPALEKRSPQVETQVSVVYVTASKTFAGPVGGYTTVLPSGYGVNDGTLSATSTAQPTSQPDPNTQAPPSSRRPKHTSQQSQESQQSQPTSTAQSTEQSSSAQPKSTSGSISGNADVSSTSTSPSAAGATSQSLSNAGSYTMAPTSSSPLQVDSPENSTTGPTASSSPSNSNDSGMSGGAKAGLALGIIILIALIAGGAFFLYRRKKREDEAIQRLHDDEKMAEPAAVIPVREPSVRSTRTPTNAPRLSLRPLTQFSPNLGGGNRVSVGNKLELTSNPNTAAQQPRSMWERPGERSDAVDGSNPFGDHAASATAPVAGAAVAGAAAGAVAAKKSGDRRRSSGVVPKPLSIKSNNSQTSLASSGVSSVQSGAPSSANISEFHLGTASTASTAIPASVATAAVPPSLSAPSGPPSNVHRVQMEFKPSMEDELELRPGQLIRILHEYDDGWALCIRMDRSQQGVAPRTCLSKLPLKPRPVGSPAQQPAPRPTGPLPLRPPIGPASMVPRPLTPTSGRNSPIDPFADAGTPNSGRARSKSNASASQRPAFLSAQAGAGPANPAQQSRRRSKSVTDLQPTTYQAPMSPRIPFGHESSSTMGSIGSIPARKPVPGQQR
ncbi:MAG: hypothetical protein M1821_004397 [Bathelium mastoideum]|nr:MAG: hypothetical protein M1821_004397 [Bathelium mastoideum]